VAVYTINGPFFFGVAAKLRDVLDQIGGPPRVFVIDMQNVPVIDATAVHALEAVVDSCRKSGTAVHLRGVRPLPRQILAKLGLVDGEVVHFEDPAPSSPSPFLDSGEKI
jgi:SulP family sulfate permease